VAPEPILKDTHHMIRIAAQAMVNMARFRNVIVHEYPRIDPDIVVQILQHHLDDLTRFGMAALGWR
jgi:uncharacterized protein YutE (UPF0331/DUF86 family)